MEIIEIKTRNVEAICLDFNHKGRKHRIAFAYRNKVEAGDCPVEHDLILLRENSLDEYMDMLDREIEFKKGHDGYQTIEGVWNDLCKVKKEVK